MPTRGPSQTTPARMGAPKSSNPRLRHRRFDKHHVIPCGGRGRSPRREPGSRGRTPEADQPAAQFQPAARIHGVPDRPAAQTLFREQICRTPSRRRVCDISVRAVGPDRHHATLRSSPDHRRPHGRARIQQPAFRAPRLRQATRHPPKRARGAAPKKNSPPHNSSPPARSPAPETALMPQRRPPNKYVAPPVLDFLTNFDCRRTVPLAAVLGWHCACGRMASGHGDARIGRRGRCLRGAGAR